MYFKKLELVGFKSFCDKTTLNFEPGITAVVGPNGCGKSNIFDSIRWVLGEQSAKSLRGSDMQDVIFNGTDLKEPLGMAEVSLAFDNQQRFFNVDTPEVMITRRIFRSGESEYLLNKSIVRLKDILDLLLGTGIGAESYSIVAQGKIDLVLSSRPEDRRLVFDEASGITKYKAQKRETMRRLDETEQNLLRINDIITEVKRQIGSLERQANKARKYKEVFEELKSKEINLSILQKNELIKQKDEIINQLKELQTKESALLEAIKDQESKISNRQAELKTLEENLMSLKSQILNSENSIVRNNEHTKFNDERIRELEKGKVYLEEQISEAKSKLIIDEEKLSSVRNEYNSIRQNIESKSQLLFEGETELNALAASIKGSLDKITQTKRDILDLVTRIANTKNEISEFSSKQQIFMARKKRLELEKAKVNEEKAITEISLNNIQGEVDNLKKAVDEINSKISELKSNLGENSLSLNNTNTKISDLEKQKLTLESQREFLKELKTKYEDIGESLNAVIYLDKMPSEKVSGLVIKVKDYVNLDAEDRAYFDPASFKLSGEAKPIELDTQKIDEKILKLEEEIKVLQGIRETTQKRIEELNIAANNFSLDLRNQEIALANKETSRLTILEQFNKIKEEEDIIVIELQDVSREISALEQNIVTSQNNLSELNKKHRFSEDAIVAEEDRISTNSKLREVILVSITQTRTELEALNKRIFSDEETLKILEDTYRQDRERLDNCEKQIKENSLKTESLKSEIKECQIKIKISEEAVKADMDYLRTAESSYKEISDGASVVINKIESDREELDTIKNSLYELQIQNKDIDYKYSAIKVRMLESYKFDLESVFEVALNVTLDTLTQEIAKLKERLDSYGTVNLVAIEEYDELKKRYDFLIQQQTDLLNAKESLHQAILKINRTTKQMFLETFEKVRVEFRNYFRLLFNGGDAQVYLIDEQDPLESGIEIICRPPGRKLQNVLLLSGGEKSMSAIALIFAIFKVKPSPFCILDEIDAALDEANVDRFSRILQEFAKGSQFIVITHNKRTIANADVMYGITMQESGVSKIVSVKFSSNRLEKDKELETAVV